MRNLKLEAEVVQVSIYSNIILHILRKHKEISVNKILVFAYLIKKDRFYLFNIYNGNNTQDIIYKCISLLAGDYVEYCNSISFIIKAIHLLIANKQVIFENNLLIAIPIENTDKMIYQESMFIDKAIEVSKRMTDKQLFLPGRKDRKLPGLPVHEMPDIMTIKRKRKKRSLNGDCVGAQKSGTLPQKLWLLYMITGWMAIPRKEFSM